MKMFNKTIFLIFNFMLFMFIFMFMFMIMIKKLLMMKNKFNFMKSIECGFNNFNIKHLPMMNNFILIMIIFMIFDLEFFMMIPLIYLFKFINWFKLMFMFMILFMFIYLTMFYEIKFNSIIWIK